MDITEYKPSGRIHHKHLLTLKDYTSTDIYEILHLAMHLKKLYKKGKHTPLLKNKTLAMIFAKSSTRTRVSFEQGMKQLGGTSLFLSSNDIQLGRGETIHDTAKTLSRYGIDGVMIRTFKQSDIDELALCGDFSVINGLSDDYHPCQALADLLTVFEIFGRLDGLKLVYSGDPNNVSNSLMIGCAKTGVRMTVLCPKEYQPNNDIIQYTAKFGQIEITDDVDVALKNANVVYTDVFFSMGQSNSDEKRKILMPFQVNKEMMAKASTDAVFMHCLPAHRGEEVSADVIDSACSVVFEQAENRMHVQKAIMALLIG